MEFNEVFSRALGHGPEGPTYVAPRARRASPLERTRAWVWYRWGWGSRPAPRHVPAFETPVDLRDVGHRAGRHSADARDESDDARRDEVA